MNDYMKSLQKHFDRQEHNELDERIRCVREELRQDLGTESRRRLLHLLDAQNTLLVDSLLNAENSLKISVQTSIFIVDLFIPS